MTSANSVAPSIRPAAISIAVWIVAADCGCRAMPSIALPARRPMPKPPPIDRQAGADDRRRGTPSAARFHRDVSSLVRVRPDAQCAGCTDMPMKLRREHGEDVGLQERDEQLEQVDEQREGETATRHRRAPYSAQDEDHRDEREDHDVSGHHVGEQADRQRERLDEHARGTRSRT